MARRKADERPPGREEDERALWAHVTRDTRPLARRASEAKASPRGPAATGAPSIGAKAQPPPQPAPASLARPKPLPELTLSAAPASTRGVPSGSGAASLRSRGGSISTATARRRRTARSSPSSSAPGALVAARFSSSPARAASARARASYRPHCRAGSMRRPCARASSPLPARGRRTGEKVRSMCSCAASAESSRAMTP